MAQQQQLGPGGRGREPGFPAICCQRRRVRLSPWLPRLGRPRVPPGPSATEEPGLFSLKGHVHHVSQDRPELVSWSLEVSPSQPKVHSCHCFLFIGTSDLWFFSVPYTHEFLNEESGLWGTRLGNPQFMDSPPCSSGETQRQRTGVVWKGRFVKVLALSFKNPKQRPFLRGSRGPLHCPPTLPSLGRQRLVTNTVS